MDDTELADVAERLFAAFVAHDLDAVEAMLAPGAQVTQNGASLGWADARLMIAGLRDILGDHRYTDVRRVIGDHSVVEEHHVRSTTPAGQDVDLAACVVIRVDADGLITELDEYVDTAPLLAPPAS